MSNKEIKRILDTDINTNSPKYPESTISLTSSISNNLHNPSAKIHHNY